MADERVQQKNDRRVAVVAMDGSPQAESALDFYVNNVRKDNDDLVLMYCVHHRAQHTYGSVFMPVDPNIVAHAYHEESKKGDVVCQHIKEKLDTYKIEGQVMKLEGGDPGHTMLEKCKEIGAGLIVVGTRGLGTIRRTILGSVSGFMVHHADIPVFVCKH